ncbi:leucine-rich receptor-like protein kinase family protein [Wolffia australiana]
MAGIAAALLLFLAAVAAAQLPSPEIIALLEFKKAISRDPTGYIFESWNEEAIDFNGCPSSWNGIVCSGAQVAGVVLDNLSLVGRADLAAFAAFPMLMKLSLANNSISGELNFAKEGFPRLQFLDLSNNLFTGAVPAAIGRLTSLQNLSLAGNALSGPLPGAIAELVALRSLDLSRNNLSGPLPSRLAELKSLASLKLSSNAFSRRMITGLEAIPGLVELDLSWNRLEGGVDWTFMMESSAVFVDLSGNSFISLGPKEMSFLSDVAASLRHLNLSHNQLSGSLIGGGGVPTFGNLRVLDLSHNQLSGELPGFDYAYYLEVLRLRGNGFSGFVPRGLLDDGSLVLAELDLSSNNLSGHIGAITSTMLQSLNLSSNAIAGELPLLTGACTVLDLSGNAIGGNLSAMAKWGSNLEFIDLSRNKLAGPWPPPTAQFLRLNHLNLSHNALSGPLPSDLAQFGKLIVLDLGSNGFAGDLAAELLFSPSLEELHLQSNLLRGGIIATRATAAERSGLRVLDLAHNQLNGSLSLGAEFRRFPDLQLLDVAGNRFSGRVPTTMSELVSLSSLDISQNQFSGPLPVNLPGTLKSFNASDNNLSGAIPENLRKFPESAFRPGNPGLELPKTEPDSSPTGNGVAVFRRRGLAAAKLAAIVAGAAVAAVVLVVVVVVVVVGCRRRRARRSVVEEEASGMAFKFRGTETTSEEKAAAAAAAEGKGGRFSWSPESGEWQLGEQGRGRGPGEMSPPGRLAGELRFLDEGIGVTAEQLSRAPAEVLGRSSHGTSYKATLDNGVVLAVKWLREGVAKPKKDFAREALKFANIRHPNVVPLRAYYWGPTPHEKLLLFDFIAPGSLASVLYDRAGRRGPTLGWVQRLRIAVDAARGLNYLHLDRGLAHGNLKASNVLLEGLDLTARIADYGLHRLMTLAGTAEQLLDAAALGYRAPELAAPRRPVPSLKSDVYAFGVLLLELLTGRCAGDLVSADEGAFHLPDWVRLRVSTGPAAACFDPTLAADPLAAKPMSDVLALALRCLRPAADRPDIKSLYEDLSSL